MLLHLNDPNHDGGNTVVSLTGRNYIIGSTPLSKGVHTWRITVIQSAPNDTPCAAGIVYDHRSSTHQQNDSHYYGLGMGTVLQAGIHNGMYHNFRFQPEDVIDFQLECDTHTLTICSPNNKFMANNNNNDDGDDMAAAPAANRVVIPLPQDRVYRWRPTLFFFSKESCSVTLKVINPNQFGKM